MAGGVSVDDFLAGKGTSSQAAAPAVPAPAASKGGVSVNDFLSGKGTAGATLAASTSPTSLQANIGGIGGISGGGVPGTGGQGGPAAVAATKPEGEYTHGGGGVLGWAARTGGNFLAQARGVLPATGALLSDVSVHPIEAAANMGMNAVAATAAKVTGHGGENLLGSSAGFHLGGSDAQTYQGMTRNAAEAAQQIAGPGNKPSLEQQIGGGLLGGVGKAEPALIPFAKSFEFPAKLVQGGAEAISTMPYRAGLTKWGGTSQGEANIMHDNFINNPGNALVQTFGPISMIAAGAGGLAARAAGEGAMTTEEAAAANAARAAASPEDAATSAAAASRLANVAHVLKGVGEITGKVNPITPGIAGAKYILGGVPLPENVATSLGDSKLGRIVAKGSDGEILNRTQGLWDTGKQGATWRDSILAGKAEAQLRSARSQATAQVDTEVHPVLKEMNDLRARVSPAEYEAGINLAHVGNDTVVAANKWLLNKGYDAHLDNLGGATEASKLSPEAASLAANPTDATLEVAQKWREWSHINETADLNAGRLKPSETVAAQLPRSDWTPAVEAHVQGKELAVDAAKAEVARTQAALDSAKLAQAKLEAQKPGVANSGAAKTIQAAKDVRDAENKLHDATRAVAAAKPNIARTAIENFFEADKANVNHPLGHEEALRKYALEQGDTRAAAIHQSNIDAAWAARMEGATTTAVGSAYARAIDAMHTDAEAAAAGMTTRPGWESLTTDERAIVHQIAGEDYLAKTSAELAQASDKMQNRLLSRGEGYGYLKGQADARVARAAVANEKAVVALTEAHTRLNVAMNDIRTYPEVIRTRLKVAGNTLNGLSDYAKGVADPLILGQIAQIINDVMDSLTIDKFQDNPEMMTHMMGASQAESDAAIVNGMERGGQGGIAGQTRSLKSEQFRTGYATPHSAEDQFQMQLNRRSALIRNNTIDRIHNTATRTLGDLLPQWTQMSREDIATWMRRNNLRPWDADKRSGGILEDTGKWGHDTVLVDKYLFNKMSESFSPAKDLPTGTGAHLLAKTVAYSRAGRALGAMTAYALSPLYWASRMTGDAFLLGISGMSHTEILNNLGDARRLMQGKEIETQFGPRALPPKMTDVISAGKKLSSKAKVSQAETEFSTGAITRAVSTPIRMVDNMARAIKFAQEVKTHGDIGLAADHANMVFHDLQLHGGEQTLGAVLPIYPWAKAMAHTVYKLAEEDPRRVLFALNMGRLANENGWKNSGFMNRAIPFGVLGAGPGSVPGMINPMFRGVAAMGGFNVANKSAVSRPHGAGSSGWHTVPAAAMPYVFASQTPFGKMVLQSPLSSANQGLARYGTGETEPSQKPVLGTTKTPVGTFGPYVKSALFGIQTRQPQTARTGTGAVLKARSRGRSISAKKR